MKFIVASGPVIIEDGKLLVTKELNKPLFQIPGGKPKENETLEETCLRELKEETGFSGKILEPLNTMRLSQNPQTNEPADITLYHFLCMRLNAKKDYSAFEHDGHEVLWLPINQIGKYSVTPNIKFLIEKGDIK